MIQDQVQILELVAGLHKGAQRLAFPHADDQLALFAQAGGQAGEIAVRRDDTEPVQVAAVQKVHRINDHGGVCGVFAGGIAVLLDGDDGVVEQYILPAFQTRVRPVAVDPLAGRPPERSRLIQDHLDIFGGYIIRVDQNRQFQIFHCFTSLAVHNTYTTDRGSCRYRSCGAGRPFCRNAAQNPHPP